MLLAKSKRKDRRPRSAGSSTTRTKKKKRNRPRPESPHSYYARTNRPPNKNYNSRGRNGSNSRGSGRGRIDEPESNLSQSGIISGKVYAGRTVLDASFQIRGNGKMIAQASSEEGAVVSVTTTSKDNKQNKTNGFVVTAHLPARALVSNVTVYIASVGLGVEYVELECADEVGTPHPSKFKCMNETVEGGQSFHANVVGATGALSMSLKHTSVPTDENNTHHNNNTSVEDVSGDIIITDFDIPDNDNESLVEKDAATKVKEDKQAKERNETNEENMKEATTETDQTNTSTDVQKIVQEELNTTTPTSTTTIDTTTATITSTPLTTPPEDKRLSINETETALSASSLKKNSIGSSNNRGIVDVNSSNPRSTLFFVRVVVEGFSVHDKPPSEAVVPLINMSSCLRNEGRFLESVDADMLCGLALLSTRRFLQANETFQRAEKNLFINPPADNDETLKALRASRGTLKMCFQV